MAIRRGEYVDPGLIQGHVDYATNLGERMRGSRMPGGFLNFVNEALAHARGAAPHEIADRIREGLARASASGSLDTVEPFLQIAERFDAGTQLTGELTSMAHYIQELAVFRNGKGKIDPEVLAGCIYESAGDVISGRAPFPLMQQVLQVYMGTSGKQVALPPFAGGVRRNLTAAAPAIMEAVNAALPPEQRNPAFLDRMRTSMVGKIGGAVGNGSLKAIEQDVTPLLTHLRGMLSGNPAEARRDLGVLLGA
jgi:hypothetical protein